MRLSHNIPVKPIPILGSYDAAQIPMGHTRGGSVANPDWS
jgi:hypothetical protein